jgi:hypothetical protein
MIKDIVVNLTVGAQRDVAADYAMSMARASGAHLAAVSFCYEMVVPGSVFGTVATGLIQAQRAENEKAATDAITGFEETARLAGVSFETRLFHAPLVDAVEMFGRMLPIPDFLGRAAGGARHAVGHEHDRRGSLVPGRARQS